MTANPYRADNVGSMLRPEYLLKGARAVSRMGS